MYIIINNNETNSETNPKDKSRFIHPNITQVAAQSDRIQYQNV